MTFTKARRHLAGYPPAPRYLSPPPPTPQASGPEAKAAYFATALPDTMSKLERVAASDRGLVGGTPMDCSP